MARAKTKVDGVVLLVRNLLERLHAGTLSPATADSKDRGMVMSLNSRLGGFRVTGKEARMLQECEGAMVELKGGNPELRALSREACSQLLRTTVLRAIRPTRGATGSREVFERRLGRELRRLRRALLAQPQQWLVTLPVHGFYKGGLPFTFGGIAFQQCDDTATRALAARIGTFEPRRRVREEKVRAENRARRRLWRSSSLASSITTPSQLRP